MSKGNGSTVCVVANAARSFLFPPRCVACGELLHPCTPAHEIFCPLCRTAWEAAVAEAAEQSVEDSARGSIYLTLYHSGRVGGVSERLVYHLKHRGSPRAFRFVAERLAHRLAGVSGSLPMRETDSDLDAPVLFTYPPRRRAAVRREGFDQAKRLARAMSRAYAKGFTHEAEVRHVSLIRRTHRPVREQKELDAQGRAENAARSFALTRRAAKIARGRVVVLCDDVCTTGATLHRCAEQLVSAGARGVIFVTVARTD